MQVQWMESPAARARRADMVDAVVAEVRAGVAHVRVPAPSPPGQPAKWSADGWVYERIARQAAESEAPDGD